jgi:hypothetical protein
LFLKELDRITDRGIAWAIGIDEARREEVIESDRSRFARPSPDSF